MRNFKKRTIALCLASAITVLGSFSDEKYQNSLMSLRIENGSNGYVSFTAFTKKPYLQTIQPEKVDDNTYSVILYGTKSELSSMPSISQYSNIDSIKISTFPYAKETEGYTSILITTKGEPTIDANTSLYIEDKSPEKAELSQNLQQKQEPKKEEEIPVKKQTSYWDRHADTSLQSYSEQNKSIDKKPVSTGQNTSFKQKNTQVEDFNSNYANIEMNNSNEILPILVVIVIITCLVLFIIFLRKDQMDELVGNQKDFDFDENKKGSSKSKRKQIRGKINQLDKTYKNVSPLSNVNIVTGASVPQEPVVEKAFKDEEETIESVVVDLDSLYKEKTKEKKQIDEETKEAVEDENAVDDLAEFLDSFSFEEVPPEPQNSFDEELYESVINNENLHFSNKDIQKIRQLLQCEIGDETYSYLKQQPKPKKIPTEMEILENVLSEYTIKQNLTFTKDDVDAIRKLMKVELDDNFVLDLKTNPKRTEIIKQEIQNKEKKPHKSSEMLILNVKDLLPDLSKELKKQGNKRIEPEERHDVVYYSEGYDVSKLSVSSDLANMSQVIHNKDLNKFRPSDEVPIVESGYDFKTLSIKDSLPNIEDYKKHPDRYEDKKVKEKVDEKALLHNIENVKFKPFYENVQEELSHFEGFEVIDSEHKEEYNFSGFEPEIKNREEIRSARTVDEEAKKLLELIEEKHIEKENKKLAEPKPKEQPQKVIQKDSISDGVNSTTCRIEGKSYDIVKSVKCDGDMSCYLAKNNDKYFVIGKINEEYKIFKQYDNLRTETMQTRINEKKPDGSIQYLIRVSIHKFIVNVTKNSGMEFVMDLC